MAAGGRGGWKPFLHHVSKGKPYRGRAITLKEPKTLPRILRKLRCCPWRAGKLAKAIHVLQLREA